MPPTRFFDYCGVKVGAGLPVPIQLNTRCPLTAPAGSQMALPVSLSVPVCRTGRTDQRKTCGVLLVGRKLSGTIYLLSLT